MNNKINPSIWFHTNDGKLQEIVTYYVSVFGDAFIANNIIPLGQTPSGNAEMCNVTLFGQTYAFMSTEKEHTPLNDSISLIINCEDQSEIDTYWNYFTKEGKESQCGWCIDKYGLRWQVLPKNLGELMNKPNAWKVMMSQKKIIIAEY
jgi:predicted 3-demethylubiquinone-9 3-methyltransferase (glyoxalase superfamily)